MKLLTKPEEILLLSVCILKDEAYGLKILNFVSEQTGYEWSVGSIYIPLDRLVRLGFVDSYMGEPTAVRGGKRKRYFRITPKGLQALKESKKVQLQLWQEIPELSLKIK